ncbi:tetratricopeptide repeat protein [Flavobacterium zepuense]|uniref:Tetratricopeptide repeat protein n=1 Tax=Flavobacterium zepuense TaxID=2593302 RepID=A0A552UWZ7_9FLAO|nr:tetratricopeptide repeat protein [Flavobacterium zepuense]TRW22729.1 tetratricopeptide repeat protein [Flavobacterium zepuense]
MKNLAYILLFLTQLLAAQSFDKGNALYRKADYNGASQEYEGILKQGKESAEVYFNLGNAYYKLDKVAPSIYNFEKALLLNPGYKDAEVNLTFANKMVIDDIKATPKVGFGKIVHNLTGSYHYDTWAWIAVSFSAFFLALFLGYYLAGTTLLKRIFFVGMFVVLLGIVLNIIAAVYVKSHDSRQNPAIVFAEVVSVKGEPNAKSQDAFILHEGTKVNVTETVDNWKKIVLADDSVGWIDAGAIKELK